MFSRHQHRHGIVLLALALTPFASACDKTVGESLRPDERTAAEATGSELTCAERPTRIKPLVVDWDPDERVDLEAAMAGSVVVVRYDCPGLEILPGCTVDGDYAYAGVSRKEQVVQMTNMDQVRANVPVKSGAIGGEVMAGRALNLATVYVGRQSTTVNHLTQGDLSGQCEGATHFVRSASLGAFSMATGSKGKAMVVAEMFGVGAAASSDAQKQSLNADGSLEACRTSGPGDQAPPDQCRAPVKIELVPIAAGEAGEGAKAVADALKQGEAAQDECVVPGYVQVNGICQAREADAAYTCAPKDEGECKTQCDKGSMRSCYNLGLLAGQELGAAQVPLAKACKGGETAACARLGDMIWNNTDLESSNAKAMAGTAYRMLSTACDDGVGYGCEVAGDIHSEKRLSSMFDASRAYGYYARACDLGRNYGCYEQGWRLLKGDGVAANVQNGVDVWTRACEGGSADECALLANAIVKGEYGLGQRKDTGVSLYVAACRFEVDYCEDAGKGIEALGGNPQTAAAAYQKDCSKYPGSEACGRLGMMHLRGRGVAKDASKGKALLAGSCREGHDWACTELGKL